jgi:Endosomal/lysosomal potassium channel TMEM175
VSARDAAGGADLDTVVFLGDGVFTIAIALPGLSFAVIGLDWMGHHRVSRHGRAVDRRLIVLTLFFVGLIAFLPNPTAAGLGVGGPRPAWHIALRSASAVAVLGCSIPIAFASPRAMNSSWGLVFVARAAPRARYADAGAFD